MIPCSSKMNLITNNNKDNKNTLFYPFWEHKVALYVPKPEEIFDFKKNCLKNRCFIYRNKENILFHIYGISGV